MGVFFTIKTEGYLACNLSYVHREGLCALLILDSGEGSGEGAGYRDIDCQIECKM